MSEQSEALRLADALDTFHNPNDKQVAAELRRLHAENDTLRRALRLIENTDPLAASLDPEWAVRVARWALKECK
jgi:hypothetical protein